MHRINIQRETGFPVQRRTLDFLQQAYGSAIEHLCRVYGNNVILYGVEHQGVNRTAGAVVIDGELLPFEQSPNSAHVVIVETVESVQFQGGDLLPAYVTRVARCAPSGGVALSSLRRVDTLLQPLATPWETLTPAEGLVEQGHIVILSAVQVRRNNRGAIEFRGVIRQHSEAPEIPTSFSGIPIQFRPARSRPLWFVSNRVGANNILSQVALANTVGVLECGFAQAGEYFIIGEYFV